jgi:hypothetical protein
MMIRIYIKDLPNAIIKNFRLRKCGVLGGTRDSWRNGRAEVFYPEKKVIRV